MITDTPRIIVVDDDIDVCNSIRRSCLRLMPSWDITVVDSGRSALDMVAEQPVDLVITDIHMPDYDGLDVINLLRECCPSTKIIAMSGGGRMPGSDSLALAEVVGADATIEKPFDFKTLLELCHSTLSIELV